MGSIGFACKVRCLLNSLFEHMPAEEMTLAMVLASGDEGALGECFAVGEGPVKGGVGRSTQKTRKA